MQKLIMFNGPPRAGKDTASQICERIFGEDMSTVKFTQVVKELAHKKLGLDERHDAFELVKDVALPEFEWYTPRQFYIRTSEQLKEQHGHDIVARMTAERAGKLNTPVVVNSDVGFDFEAEALIDRFGQENTLLIRIHRAGKNYDNDCRDWVDPQGVITRDCVNGDLNLFERELLKVIDEAGFTPESLVASPLSG